MHVMLFQSKFMSRPTDLFSICTFLFISTLNPAPIKDGSETTINATNKSTNTEAKIQAGVGVLDDRRDRHGATRASRSAARSSSSGNVSRETFST